MQLLVKRCSLLYFRMACSFKSMLSVDFCYINILLSEVSPLDYDITAYYYVWQIAVRELLLNGVCFV